MGTYSVVASYQMMLLSQENGRAPEVEVAVAFALEHAGGEFDRHRQWSDRQSHRTSMSETPLPPPR